MKKGFITLIACVFTMVTFQSYAMAPVISGLPDIGICDDEGLTVPLNWYRYENAYLLTDFVTDQDSDSDTWKVSFMEASTDNDISINKKYQYDGDKTNPPAGNELGAGYLSFQDMIRSPERANWADPTVTDPYPDPASDPGDPTLLQFHDADGSMLDDGPRVVSLFVSDGVNVSSDTFEVMSIDDGQTLDHLSNVGPVTRFTADLPTWDQKTFAGTQAITFGSNVNGDITMTSSLNGTGDKYFGRYQSPPVNTYEGEIRFDDSYGDDFIYAGVYTVKHDRAAGALNVVPSLRFGAAMAFGHVDMIQKIASFPGSSDDDANPMWPQTADSSVEYVAYWESFQNHPLFDSLANFSGYDLRTWHVFVDLLNFNATDQGTWTVEGYHVFAIDRPADVTPAYDYPTPQFGTGGTDWTNYQTFQTAGITPTNNAGGFTFVNTNNYATANYYATSAPDQFDWQKGKVVRLSAWLAADTGAGRAFSKTRIRSGSTGGHLGHVFSIVPSTVDAISPGETSEQYSTYLASYGGPSALLVGFGDKILWGVDYMTTSPGTGVAANVQLDAARVEVLDDMLGMD